MKGVAHSEETRESVLKDVESGQLSQKEVAVKYKISPGTVASWVSKSKKRKKPKRGAAKEVPGIKALSKHRNIKEARLLLEEFRNLVPDIKKVSRRDLLALLALTELEQIP